jgi:hypothetical protein
MKLVHLVGFVLRICHDARSHKLKIWCYGIKGRFYLNRAPDTALSVGNRAPLFYSSYISYYPQSPALRSPMVEADATWVKREISLARLV